MFISETHGSYPFRFLRRLFDREREGEVYLLRSNKVTKVVPAKGEPDIAAVAQLVERVLGKDEVMGPSPISS